VVQVNCGWRALRLGRRFPRQQGVEHDEDATANDGRVGDVEVRPVIAPVAPTKEDFKKIGDDAVADTIPDVAERTAEDEGERDRRGGEAAAYFEDQAKDDDGSKDREGGQQPARASGGSRVGEEAEGCSGVEDVRDEEVVRYDGDLVAFGDVVLHPDLGPAVEHDDECGDGEEPAAAVLFQIQSSNFLMMFQSSNAPDDVILRSIGTKDRLFLIVAGRLRKSRSFTSLRMTNFLDSNSLLVAHLFEGGGAASANLWPGAERLDSGRAIISVVIPAAFAFCAVCTVNGNSDRFFASVME